MFFQEMNFINLQLVVETLLAGFFLAHPIYKKRNHFIPRWILSSLLMIVLGYFFPIVSPSNAYLMLLYWFFMYTCLLFFPVPVLMISYDMDFINALLLSMASYLIHHTNNIFASLITDPITYYSGLTDPGLTIIKWNINLMVLLLTYLVFFRYYYSQRKENLQLIFDNKQLNFFSLVVIIFTILLSSGVRVFYHRNLPDALYFVGLISNFLSCILLLTFFFVFLRHNRLQQELDIEKRMLNESKKQYELSKENIESLNIKFHDLKYRLQLLSNKGSEATKEDFKDIYEGLNIYDSLVKTGNKALDVVLSQYSLRAQNNEIKFTSICDGKAISFMEDYDIYTLFGNIITNAIEATSKLTNKEKRHISMVMKRKGNILYIDVENFFEEGKMKMTDGKIETTKKDKNHHGYGSKSIRNIVEKYNGVLSYSLESDIFHLKMTFLTQEEKHD